MADRPTHEKLEQSVNDLKQEAAKPQRAEQERRRKQLRSTDRVVREAIEYAEALVDTVREPLVVLGGDLRIRSANRSFYQVFGVQPEETLGAFIYDLGNRQWDISKLRELLEEILPQKTRFDGFEVEHDFENIGKKIMLLNARRIERKSEGTQLILLAIEDVTDRVRAEEQLQKSAESIKLFAYSVAHDLKGPSVGIYGLTRLLHKHYADILDEKGKNYCAQILQATEQIAALVDKINVYISTKEVPLTIERLRLQEILMVVREEFSPRLNIRQIKWSESPHMPEINADRLSILRVLRNLIDNALKYGGDDLSKINIGCEQSDEFYVLFVKDDGMGIRREDFKKIFTTFERTQTSMGIEGTGLGLAIVKEIAEQHGGEVWVEPGPEKGISFYVSIQKKLQPSCPM